MFITIHFSKRQFWAYLLVISALIRALYINGTKNQFFPNMKINYEYEEYISFYKSVFNHIFYFFYIFSRKLSKSKTKKESIYIEEKKEDCLVLETKEVKIKNKNIRSTLNKSKKFKTIVFILLYAYLEENQRLVYLFFDPRIYQSFYQSFLNPIYLLLFTAFSSFIVIKKKSFLLVHEVLSFVSIFVITSIILFIVFLLEGEGYMELLKFNLTGILMSLRAIEYVIIQSLMDEYYINPYLLISIQSTISLAFHLSYILITRKYKEFWFGDGNNSKLIVIKIFYCVLTGITTFLRLFTVNKCKYNNAAMGDVLGSYIMSVFKYIFEENNFKPLLFSGAFLCMFFTTIFNETIVLKFCGLDKDVRSEIRRRQKTDMQMTKSGSLSISSSGLLENSNEEILSKRSSINSNSNENNL